MSRQPLQREDDEIYDRYNLKKGVERLAEIKGTFDKISASTVGRIHVKLLVVAARWEWNQRALQQAFGDFAAKELGTKRHTFNMVTVTNPPLVAHVRTAEIVAREFELHREKLEQRKQERDRRLEELEHMIDEALNEVEPMKDAEEDLIYREQVVEEMKTEERAKEVIRKRGEKEGDDSRPLPVGKMFRRGGNTTPIAYCGLFAVLKALDLLRLIFDGRPGNAHFNKDDAKPFRLFTLNELMEALDYFIWEKECHFITGDLRHFYYQLKMCDYYARFFAIRMGDWLWYPLVMCMGFFAVCYWAQATTITMLLHEKSLVEELGICEQEVSAGMPPIIWLYGINEYQQRIRKGFIGVLMDGFLLVTTDRKLKQAWAKRIVSNMAHFNAELKEVKTPFDELLKERYPDKIPDGLELRKPRDEQQNPTTSNTQKKRVLDISEIGAVFNGMIIVKGEGWTTEAELGEMPLNLSDRRKQWARVLGELLWAYRVSRTPLIDKLEVMRIYPALHSGETADWNDEVSLSPGEYQVLEREVGYFKNHIWAPRLPRFASHTYYGLLSDANPTCKGRILLQWNNSSCDFELLEEVIDPVDKASQMLQEMTSVVDGVESIIRREWEDRGCCIIIGIDPDPVRFALIKGYSRSKELVDQLLRLHQLVHQRKVTMLFVRIPGKDLVADMPSRGYYAYRQSMNDGMAWKSYVRSAKDKEIKNQTLMNEEVDRRKKESERILRVELRSRMLHEQEW